MIYVETDTEEEKRELVAAVQYVRNCRLNANLPMLDKLLSFGPTDIRIRQKSNTPNPYESEVHPGPY